MIATMPSMARRSRHDNKITTPAVDCLTIERLDSPASGAPQVTPYARALMGETTTCAIIGGGPAGMVLGLLLARAGVQVTLLEKHGDFLRDFRGDTVHPTTMRLLDELGLWERFAALPYSEVRTATLHSNGRAVTYIDFERLHQPYPYVAMVPQWDLLNLLAEAAQAEPSFTLRMKTEVTGLLREGGKVTGVRYQGAEGPGELRAELTVACDGRWSIARHEAGLKAREFPVNFDVWWFKLPREGDAEFSFLPRFSPGKGLGVIPREGYFQIAYLGPKGTDAQLRERGIEEFRRDVSELLPEATASVAALASMDEVKHLNVKVNRLRRWHIDGLLCIGDAAHAMSPVAGVGINLAVQDAVAAATILAEPLREHRVSSRHLAAVRRRRAFPTAVTQAVQRVLHRRLLGPLLQGRDPTPPAALLGLVERLPWLSAVPAYFVGVGVRPEHAPASHVAGPATAKALEPTCAPPRIGVLGIARIAPLALIKPVSGSVVVAARDVSRVARPWTLAAMPSTWPTRSVGPRRKWFRRKPNYAIQRSIGP